MKKPIASRREIWGYGHPLASGVEDPPPCATIPSLCLPLGREVRLLADDEPRIRHFLSPLGRDGFVACNHQ